MVNVTVQVQGLNELVGGFGLMPELMAAENQKAMVAAAHLAESYIKTFTPRKTGRLQSAWTPSVEGVGFASIGIVSDEVGYAAAVEEGAAPHDIYATEARALAIPYTEGFGFGGGTLAGRARKDQAAFFARVHHPGMRGRHMAKLGLEAATPGIVDIFSLAAQRAIRMALGKTRGAIRTFSGGAL